MSATALAWRQFRFERRMFWRNPSAAFFNFALPLIFLFLIAGVFGLNESDREILIPGIAGMSVMTTTFTALAFNVTFLREQGILKRIKGTPLPPISYFGGLIANAVANALVQVALVIAIGNLLYDVPWPHDWLELAVFVLLGVVAFSALGIAMAQLIPNFDSAAAYVNAVFLPMIFISGTFYESKHLPDVLDAVARILPLRHVIDGLRASITSGSGLTDNLEGVVVLLAWCAGGVFLALRYFRWE
ncbi:MAG: type transport system permease protein [Solirubrobacteraceae bacterium]|nr:type transport system permease protein [Solirubrobacteraceae bacterium]